MQEQFNTELCLINMWKSTVNVPKFPKNHYLAFSMIAQCTNQIANYKTFFQN